MPASGFYEWQRIPGGKQPWYVTSADGAMLAFAGLREHESAGTESAMLSAIEVARSSPVAGSQIRTVTPALAARHSAPTRFISSPLSIMAPPLRGRRFLRG